MRRLRTMLRKTGWQIAYLFGLSLHVAAVQAYASVAVEWKDERLSVAAEKVPLAQILREIAQRIGVEIRGGEGLQEQVSVCFADLLLHEGLQKLSLNYLVLWKTASPGSQRPVLAVVSAWKGVVSSQPCSSAVATVATKETIATPIQPKLPARQESLSAEKLKLRAAAATLLSGDDHHDAIATLIEGAKSERAHTRLEALRALSQSDHVEEAVVLATLQTALTDEDEDVRGYAEQTLKEREAFPSE